MVIPQQVDKSAAFFVMNAILKVACENKNVVKKLFCPGLATGTGRVNEIDAAEEMASAYRKWKVRLYK